MSRKGQSILEYTMIVVMLMMALFYMGTGIKRGVQSLVKITADQVGNQQNSDQDFNYVQQGYMMAQNSDVQENTATETTESGWINNQTNEAHYLTNTSYNESSYSTSNAETNGGFSAGS